MSRYPTLPRTAKLRGAEEIHGAEEISGFGPHFRESPLASKIRRTLGSGCDCDVLVIGGGPAGLATAIGLRMMTSLKVVVADARVGGPAERFGETIPPGAIAALDRLGVLADFRGDGHLPSPGGLSAWGSAKPGHNDHVLDPYGPAWHLDRRAFEQRLRTRAAELGVEIRPGIRLPAAGPGSGNPPAVGALEPDGPTSSSSAWSTRAAGPGPAWIVDASGSSRWLAHQFGINRVRQDRLVAILGFATLDAGNFPDQTMVEATPYGWWYASRLPTNRLVSALITDPAAARKHLEDEGRQWLAARAGTTLLAPALARCQLSQEPLITRGINVSILDQVAGPGWLAVGDAASERDPITGAGIHDALLDAADAAWTIAGATGYRAAPPWLYQERVRARFKAHLQTRAALYASEQRWPAAEFWRNRQRDCSDPPPTTR